MAKYKRLEARVVTVDPGREIVMERVKAMRQPEMEPCRAVPVVLP
ncbi:hypothetical protein [Streptomyces sp. NPDC048508]